MRIRYRILLISVIIVGVFFMFAFSSPFKEQGRQYPPISPQDPNAQSIMDYRLYYQMRDEKYLVAVEGKKSLATGKREQEMISQLLQEPENTELESPFWEGVRLVSVESTSGILYVTLTREFLSPPFEGGISKEQRIQTAMYSLINTVLDGDSPYHAVQILVDKNNTERGARPTRGEVGLEDNPEKSLEPLEASQELILSPRHSVSIAIRAIDNDDMEKLRSVLSADGEGNRPSIAELEQMSLNSKYRLLAYKYRSTRVDEDDEDIAYVSADFTLKHQEEETDYFEQEFKLILENDVWKVDIHSLEEHIFKTK